MAGSTVCSAELSRDFSRGVVASNALDHGGQADAGQVTTFRHSRVARGAIEPERIFHLEVGRVRKLDVYIGALNWCFVLIRSMAAHAFASSDRSAQVRMDTGLGMASCALSVRGSLRLSTAGIELVTKRTISAESGGWIESCLRVDVFSVREVNENTSHARRRRTQGAG